MGEAILRFNDYHSPKESLKFNANMPRKFLTVSGYLVRACFPHAEEVYLKTLISIDQLVNWIIYYDGNALYL